MMIFLVVLVFPTTAQEKVYIVATNGCLVMCILQCTSQECQHPIQSLFQHGHASNLYTYAYAIKHLVLYV
jgi:hypothetical protein